MRLSQGDGDGEDDSPRVEPLPQRAAEGAGHGDLRFSEAGRRNKKEDSKNIKGLIFHIPKSFSLFSNHFPLNFYISNLPVNSSK